MANPEHVELIKQGAKVWNNWRNHNRDAMIDLRGSELYLLQMSGADLSGVTFRRAKLATSDFSHADLRGADFAGAYLGGSVFAYSDLSSSDFTDSANASNVNFFRAKFTRANLFSVNLSHSNLKETDFANACLAEANLGYADLTRANLAGADLSRADFVKTNLSGANISGCRVFGISAWDTILSETRQVDLIIAPPRNPYSPSWDTTETIITIDNLEIAQFVYLLINNEKIRNVIDTITSKVVLILGNFSPARKLILESIRNQLRNMSLIPVLFDFQGPRSRDLTETIGILARMSRFIIADLTDAQSVAHELASIIPDLPSVPLLPILLSSQREYAMFEHIMQYPWVLPVYKYKNLNDLTFALHKDLITKTELKVSERRSLPPI